MVLALDYCHKMSISIRDVKLENTLLDTAEEGRPPLIKLCDFGYSINEQQSMPKTAVGTPGYTGAAPESVWAPVRMTAKPSSCACSASVVWSREGKGNISQAAVWMLTKQLLCHVLFGATPEVLTDATVTECNSKRMRRAAPEVLRSARSEGYDSKQADVWSSGVMLYAMLFCCYPFDRREDANDPRAFAKITQRIFNGAPLPCPCSLQNPFSRRRL